MQQVEPAAQKPAAAVRNDMPASSVRIQLIDSAAFAATNYSLRWLVRKLLVRDQPAVVGGPKKCLKTSFLCDLAVAMGTGRSFLGQFEVDRSARIGFLSGESGPHAIKTTARNVCARHGIDLASANVWWGFSLPQLSRHEQLAMLIDQIRQNNLEVVILDPLYLCLLAGNLEINASSMYDMGPLLAMVSQACLDAGATPILCHHNIKRPPDPFAIPELEDLAFAGIAEFARQWVLIGRRERFEPGSGLHKLWMNVGGSVGFSSCWSIDVDEGILDDGFDGKKWDVKVSPATEAIAGQKDQAVKKSQERQEANRKSEDAKLLLAIDQISRDGDYTSAARVRAITGFSGDKFRQAVERLLVQGLVEQSTSQAEVGKGAKRAAEVLRRSRNDCFRSSGSSGRPDDVSK
jgi:replicative DNA helicase